MTQFLLFEAASGYALFEVTALDEIGTSVDAVQASVTDLARFGKAVKLTAFRPFASAANALEQINAVSESQVRFGGGRLQALVSALAMLGGGATGVPARGLALLSRACRAVQREYGVG